jgi:ATP-dependent Clp protease ATP-binding subunit ClpA
VIQRQVENAASKRLLAGAFAEGDTVLVDHGDDGYAFTKAVPTEQAA